MSFMNGDENVLQVDERGHVRVSRERREALLEEFERSGMSGAKFARLAGIKYPTFMYWSKQRRESCGSRDEGAQVVAYESEPQSKHHLFEYTGKFCAFGHFIGCLAL
jgi:hypothetical protein